MGATSLLFEDGDIYSSTADSIGTWQLPAESFHQEKKAAPLSHAPAPGD